MKMRSDTAPTAAFAALLVLLLAPPAAASVETASPPEGSDGGWLAWYGCWEVEDGPAVGEGSLLVCFSAMETGAGVEIRTLVDGEVMGVERMIADGTPSPIEEGGCAGERAASWSSDGARVFIRSHMRCAEGITRETSGIMAMSTSGPGWLEIHAVKAGESESVLGVQHFVPATRATLEAHGTEAPAHGQELAVRTARAAATAALDLDDVLEVVREADAEVARALVAEMGQPFRLDANALRDAKQRGMPADLLDVLVAVTYPERFEIAGDSREAERAAPAGAQRRATAPWGMGPRPYGVRHRLSWYYSPYAWSPWGYDPFWHGTWGTRRVIVVQPTVHDRRARVNPLTGYSSSRTTNRTATPQGSRSGSASDARGARPTPTGVRQGGASTSSGSTGSRATRQGQSGDQSGGRRATRRTGGGG